jgi:hypothetical protein
LTGKLLGGWQISGITYFFTGLPFTATTANLDAPGLGLLGASPSGFRPDVICDPNSGGAGTFSQFFNTACFANVPAGINRVGNEARGVINGPDDLPGKAVATIAGSTSAGPAACAFSILGATAALIFPVMLRSTTGQPSLTVSSSAAPLSSLQAAFTWWIVAAPLAIAYFVTIFRLHRRQVG